MFLNNHGPRVRNGELALQTSKARRSNQVLSELLRILKAPAGLSMLSEGHQKKKKEQRLEDEQRNMGP